MFQIKYIFCRSSCWQISSNVFNDESYIADSPAESNFMSVYGLQSSGVQ